MSTDKEKLFLDLLLDIEWEAITINANSVCPSCRSILLRGHLEDCKLAACLKALDQEPKMIDRKKYPKGLTNQPDLIYSDP